MLIIANMLTKGTVLNTKDGRKIGNAIVVEDGKFLQPGIIVYPCRTDFGNIVLLTENEIREWFMSAMLWRTMLSVWGIRWKN